MPAVFARCGCATTPDWPGWNLRRMKWRPRFPRLLCASSPRRSRSSALPMSRSTATATGRARSTRNLRMRIAYLDCSAGISGDMLLGALIDAGAPADQLHGTLRALNIGATLEIEQVDRAGIAGTHARIMVGDHV